MKFGVVVFPGTWSDCDFHHVVSEVLHQPVKYVWHRERDLGDVDCVILPGGFSYGDYLRAGAVAEFAADGGPVLGICNGFQILCEAGLLPGALLRNEGLRFVCRQAQLTVEAASAWSTPELVGRTITLPVKHGEGRYHADRDTLDRLESDGRVFLRYASGHNVNGAARDIAGVVNEAGNVAGLMPHPEHAVDPQLPRGTDGALLFASVLQRVAARV